jgi:hypothetical protein
LPRSLFRGRDDIYALRWESKNGRSGYSPAYTQEWEQKDDGSYKHKKDVLNREYFPLTDEAIRNHLIGKCTVGIYPLLTDESRWFLAADFDRKTWQDDARAFLETGKEIGVPAALELIRQMCDVIEHRGPDDWGFLVENCAESILAIGMRRFSIIDLARGHRYLERIVTLCPLKPTQARPSEVPIRGSSARLSSRF